MLVQPLKLADYRPVFKQNDRSYENLDKPVTVRDLYDMEDRLKGHMDENYKNQNKMMGRVLYDIVKMLYFNDCTSTIEYSSLQNNVRSLINSNPSNNN